MRITYYNSIEKIHPNFSFQKEKNNHTKLVKVVLNSEFHMYKILNSKYSYFVKTQTKINEEFRQDRVKWCDQGLEVDI